MMSSNYNELKLPRQAEDAIVLVSIMPQVAMTSTKLHAANECLYYLSEPQPCTLSERSNPCTESARTS